MFAWSANSARLQGSIDASLLNALAMLRSPLRRGIGLANGLRMESAMVRASANVDWIGLGVKLGGIVALFAGAAASTMLMLTTGPRPDTARVWHGDSGHALVVASSAAVVPRS
jgi:hypothetical protein